MLNILAQGLVIVGVGILIGALFPVRRLIGQLPTGPIRRRWNLLALLIFLFIVGYLGYLMTFWMRHVAWLDLIVPAIFFFGAIFVWLTVTLALQTAIIVRRVSLLELENVTDALMGIFNRRYLDRRLAEEFERARNYALPLSVLMLDLDHFKRFNDTCGHRVGDLVLNHLGKLLLHAVRDTDIVARYGGEEIIVIATQTSAAAAVQLAERLRQHIETHQPEFPRDPARPCEMRVTVSIGVAELDAEIKDIRELVHSADQALYRAKQEGRNRVVMLNRKAE